QRPKHSAIPLGMVNDSQRSFAMQSRAAAKSGWMPKARIAASVTWQSRQIGSPARARVILPRITAVFSSAGNFGSGMTARGWIHSWRASFEHRGHGLAFGRMSSKARGRAGAAAGLSGAVAFFAIGTSRVHRLLALDCVDVMGGHQQVLFALVPHGEPGV